MLFELTRKTLFIISIIAFVVLLLAIIEVQINTHTSIISFEAPKDHLVVRHPRLKRPLIIVNGDKNLFEKYNLRGDYMVVDVPEHVVGKVLRKMKTFCKEIYAHYGTKTPINSIYNLVGKSDELFDLIDPVVEAKKNTYKMYKPTTSRAEAFVYNNNIYVV
jgi:hypothetical protein